MPRIHLFKENNLSFTSNSFKLNKSQENWQSEVSPAHTSLNYDDFANSKMEISILDDSLLAPESAVPSATRRSFDRIVDQKKVRMNVRKSTQPENKEN